MMDLIKADTWKGWRKLIAFMAALVVVAVLGWFGRMDGGNIEVCINWIVSAFVAGNVGEHFANGKNGGTDA